MLWNPRTGTAHLRVCRRGLRLESYGDRPIRRYCSRCFQPADAWLPQALLHHLGQQRRQLGEAILQSPDPALAAVG
ncbi:MAG: hypothetical protein ACE5IZ_06520 [Dehalococcoidia bacterium]